MSGSVLETFFIEYLADTKDLKKGGKEAETISDKVDQSLKDTDKTTQKLGSSFSEMVGKAGAALGALVAVRAVALGTIRASDQAFEVDLLSKALGENAEELDAWGGAVGKFGGDANTMGSTLDSFNQKIQELAIVGENDLSPVMRHLGVDFLDTQRKARKVLDIMPELADSFANLSQGEAFGLGAKLGLDRATILMLMKGRKEVQAMVKTQKELSTVDADFIRISQDFKFALMDNNRGFRSIWQTVGKMFLPAMTSALEAVTNMITFFRRHETFATSFFTVIAFGAGIIAMNFIPAVVAAATAVWALIAPFILIPAIIALAALAVGLFVDDVITFFEGGESIIGNFVGYLMRIPEAFRMVKDQVKGFISDLNPFGGSVEVSGIGAAQGAIGATNLPIASQTSNSLSNNRSSSSKSTSVQVGEIKVIADGANPDSVNTAIAGGLQQELSNAIDDTDDGIEI